MPSLPIEKILPDLLHQLSTHSSVVLCAEPGAGKTTRVPVALLDASWLRDQKIIMLEPRRLAAQRSAAFISTQLNEKVGGTVGYRIRGDAKVSAETRVEIVTEGILTRLLQHEPELPRVGAIIFDEFHERNIHSDLGLALALDVQSHLRPDLRIVIMSATLDSNAISILLNDAPVVKSTGRNFPVETIYPSQQHVGKIESAVASTLKKVLRDQSGDTIVFLPGQREIRNVEALLRDEGLPGNVVVHSLYGESPPKQQQNALEPAPPGIRKIILSTSIAETSLTINGVRIVIDAGLTRSSRFDPRRGMSGLVTTPVSQASADQRRGRAGREQPGVCYRLWTEEQHAALPQFSPPEILSADLAPLALELARWGAPEGEGLKFLDPPPRAHLAQARGLLQSLGAFDLNGKLSTHGLAMADLPVHPRLSHMMLKAKELGLGALACEVAALLEERDLLRGTRDNDIDVHSRLHTLRNGGGTDQLARARALAQTKRLCKMIGVSYSLTSDERAGILLALAYPERIAKRRGERYQLASGTLGQLPERSLLSRKEFLAVGDVDGVASEVKIFLAEGIEEEDIRTVFVAQLETHDQVEWSSREQAVVARRVTKLGAIVISETSLTSDESKIRAAMIVGIREMGLISLPWSKESLSIRSRSEWLRLGGFVPDDWPDLSDENLLATLEGWLSPFLNGVTRPAHLAKLDLTKIISAQFSYVQLTLLNRVAPMHITVPTGSHIPLDYSSGKEPILAVRLQEMFGESESPAVVGGKVKVLLHLLSPAQRPLVVTADLASFWRNAYADVRKEMRGRYPKHYWPEDPMSAEPTRRKKK